MRSIKVIRELPVKQLDASECRRLVVHNHGNSVDPLRRKAYLLKAHPGKELAFFKQGEVDVIVRAIEEGI